MHPAFADRLPQHSLALIGSHLDEYILRQTAQNQGVSSRQEQKANSWEIAPLQEQTAYQKVAVCCLLYLSNIDVYWCAGRQGEGPRAFCQPPHGSKPEGCHTVSGVFASVLTLDPGGSFDEREKSAC